MIKSFFKMSIRNQLLILLWSLITSLLIIYLLSIFKIIDHQYQVETSRIEKEIENYISLISNRSSDLNKISNNISYNPITQSYLKEINKMKKQDLFINMDKVIINLIQITPGIRNITIYAKNGNNYNLGYQYKNEIIEFSKLIDLSDKNVYSDIAKVRFNLEKIPTVKVGLPIYDINHEKVKLDKLGYLIIFLDIETFFNLNTLPEYIEIVDKNEKILTKTKIQDLNPKVLVKKIPAIGFVVTGYLNKKVLNKSIFNIVKTNSFLLLIITLFLFLLYLIVISNIVRTHNGIINYISGNTLEVRTRGYREANIINKKIINMNDQIKALTEKLVIEKTLTEKAELNFLITQINPHFLYNTLEAINGIAQTKNCVEISQITYSLGEIFRYSLESETMVNLKDEINLVENYLNTQLIRFSSRFTYSLDIEERFLFQYIPKMILQPIVENTIIHGFKDVESSGLIDINVKSHSNNDFKISIKDNGQGIDKIRLNKINNDLNREKDSSRRIGLNNIHKRLKLLFGENYGLNIDSTKNLGTCVSIRIPLKES